MIANWLVSMKTTRLFFFFFFHAEELNYQETNKRKGNMWIRMFLRSICGYSCTPTVLLSVVSLQQTQQPCEADLSRACNWEIQLVLTPVQVICFVKYTQWCAGPRVFLIPLRLVCPPVMVVEEEYCLKPPLRDASTSGASSTNRPFLLG